MDQGTRTAWWLHGGQWMDGREDDRWMAVDFTYLHDGLWRMMTDKHSTHEYHTDMATLLHKLNTGTWIQQQSNINGRNKPMTHSCTMPRHAAYIDNIHCSVKGIMMVWVRVKFKISSITQNRLKSNIHIPWHSFLWHFTSLNNLKLL